MLTVTVICDEPLLEAGLKSILDASQNFEVLSFHEGTAEVMSSIAEASPEVILYVLRPDLDLPVADLRKASPRSKIVVLARDIAPEIAHQVLQMGVRAFISTTASAESLQDCIRTVARGDLWMEKSLSMRLLDMRPVTLSRRQAQVIQLLAQGLKNKEIASALGIAEGTIKAYLTVLFEKLGAKDRFELALFGLKNLKACNEAAATPRKSAQMQSMISRRSGTWTA